VGGEDAQPDAGRTRRLTVGEAAEVMGITAEAVRKRISRSTLRTVKESGTVYILLAELPDADRMREDAGRTPDRTTDLIASMQARIDDLRGQLESEREANRENRRLLAAALERIPPQLEAPESPESPGPVDTPTEASEGPQTGAQRPWWRRIFGEGG